MSVTIGVVGDSDVGTGARRDGRALSAAELTIALRDNVDHPWKPPGGGFQGALIHDTVQSLDITVTLVIDGTIPADTLHTVLRGLGESTARAHFGVDLDGVELRTDDIGWSLGSGTPVVGAAQDLALALVLSGRRLPTGLLHGQGSERFSA